MADTTPNGASFETIAVYVVHDTTAETQVPMAFPTMENAEEYAKRECSDQCMIFTVPVVRYVTQLLPVEILVRPTAIGSPAQGEVSAVGVLADGEDHGASSEEGGV